MATISNDEVEALARRLLWEQINRSAWHHGLSAEERTAAIQTDVDRWWCLKVDEAARLLVEKVVERGKSSRAA